MAPTKYKSELSVNDRVEIRNLLEWKRQYKEWVKNGKTKCEVRNIL